MENKNEDFRILIVDDSMETVEVFSNILIKESYDVSFALSGEKALGLLKTYNYDLILLDVTMPPGMMSGFDVMEEIKKDDKTKEIPVIFISQWDDTQRIVKGLKLGGRDFITKGIEPAILTARVKTHLELYSSHRKLKKANYQIRDFVSKTVHGLRSPLTGIMGFPALLKQKYCKGNENPYLRERLDRIEQTSENMKKLIDDLLKVAANETGERVFCETDVDVIKLAKEVLGYKRGNSEKKGQKIIPDFAGKCIVKGDEGFLFEIIDNLLSNAIKYSPLGKSIWVDILKDKSFVTIKVRDEGPGITKKDESKLFKKYQTLRAKPTGGESSTGLGLAIVKENVKRHGGKVWVESEPGKGATFIVRLPIIEKELLKL